MTRAITIVDVQDDVCEGGAMGFDGGAAVAASMTSRAGTGSCDHVVATRDWHLGPGDHWVAESELAGLDVDFVG